MANRIYIVTDRIAGSVTRYVRASTLNAAVRAVADETFLAAPATTEEIYQAMKSNDFEVLDAVTPEQVDIDDKDVPAPVESIASEERKGPKRAELVSAA